MTSRERFLAACACQPLERPPVWIMRQAGRYLPEYRALKEKHSFLEMVRTPALAAEATLQPMRRFALDAAILFSDILVIPEALGQGYRFKEEGGIAMEWRLETRAQIDALRPAAAVREQLAYVADALVLLKRELAGQRALLGFGGSPWTLATYMLEGGGAEDFARSKTLFYSDRATFDALASTGVDDRGRSGFSLAWRKTQRHAAAPKTDFPMRANLVQREPARLAHWEKIGLYDAIQRQRAGAPVFVLHDGPPFTNGDVHIGTALNKTLKDIINRYKSMRGFRTPYVPGWDCHGLPIEQKVTRELRKRNSPSRPPSCARAATRFPSGWIAKQTAQFKRLGVLADWKNEYKTKAPAFEADILRTFAAFVEKGLVYRSKKPVYWSIPFETALAEAEIEYKDHVSPRSG
jgi:hypothetical protein